MLTIIVMERIIIRIVLVSEFTQEGYYQWRQAWDIDMQIKLQILVESITINPSVLHCYNDKSSYWDSLRKADLVFVYISRCNAPNTPYLRDGKQEYWNWWNLPRIAKEFMKPDAKLIVQTDDEWIWLEHPKWIWWGDKPVDDYGGPENFFKNNDILEVPDMWWTVLENPYWKKYTSKPVEYMPLPHLWRYIKEISKADIKYISNGPSNMHQRTLALLRHSSSVSDIYSTIKNVAEPLNLQVTYFSTCWTDPHIPKFNVPVSTILFVNKDRYMDLLINNCMVAVDDCTKYIGWSRFAMECALVYVPCVGSNFAVKLFFPELYTEHGDYPKQIELIKQLLNDKEFYKKMVDEGHYRMAVHLDPDRLCREMLKIIREELQPKETDVDIERELLKVILRKTLPFSMVPKRPSINQEIFDDVHHTRCNQQQWDIWYSHFARFINDEGTYKEVIQEVLHENK
jgi:hypothetical protein